MTTVRVLFSACEAILEANGCEEHLRKDKNYRRYASTVERALSLFDTTLQEWADYISFLSRLLKVRMQSKTTCILSNSFQ
jgi:hypothetical protein